MPPKILIVDDDAAVRAVLEQALVSCCDVLTAADARTALEQARTHAPALVLLDVRLPDISGLELLKAFSDSGVKTEVWMLTGDDDLDTVSEAMKLGAKGYITKPFDIPTVRGVVVNALEERLKSAKDLACDERPWRVKKEDEEKP